MSGAPQPLFWGILCCGWRPCQPASGLGKSREPSYLMAFKFQGASPR
jgi:hypothetical protein